MFENKYIQQRIEKAQSLRDLGINPYANETKRELCIQDYLAKNEEFKHKNKKLKGLSININFN